VQRHQALRHEAAPARAVAITHRPDPLCASAAKILKN
jgi:hypothetical protein